MKLVTKISLAATVSLLLFSQIILWYLLVQSNQVVLENRIRLESEKLESSCKEMEKLLSKVYNLDQSMNQIVMVECFRENFYNYAALYQGNTEIWNQTIYEFSEERFWAYHPKLSGVSGIRYVQTSVGEKEILLFEREVTFQEISYQIFQYQDLTDLTERLQRLFWQGIGFSLCVIAVMNLLLRFSVKKILYPFYELKRAATVLSAGNYKERALVRTKDEVGEVAESFNQMAEKVQEHVRELSDLSESQRQMMGSLAHELKTPMTAIQGYAETLLRVRLSEEKKMRALQYIESECKRLSRLSVKMLELTGFYYAEGMLHFEKIAVKELFEEATVIFQTRLDQKHIGIQIETSTEKQEEEELWVFGEKDLLLTFLLNCLENAYRASKEGGRILLGARKNEIWVQDFGIGIPAHEIEKLTEAFYMVDRSRSRKEGGAGLGLALCSQIAKLHHAELKIESEEGKGTRVLFCLQEEEVANLS